MSEPLAERFYTLFRGLDEAHGTFKITGYDEETKKQDGYALTKKEPVTVALWERHLAGKESLGVIPINKDSKCKWGAIDIDTYFENESAALTWRTALVDLIEEKGLPLYVFVSKSGGAHLYLFMDKDIKAVEMQRILSDYRVILQLDKKTEIFPKQKTIDVKGGDVGNWINMPFFGGSRLCQRPGQVFLSAEAFVDQIVLQTISEIKGTKVKADTAALEEGPPCLQTLIVAGFPEGTRNNALFNLGVYARKRYGDRFGDHVKKYNQEYIKPPLSPAEVSQLIGSLSGKEYSYKCSDMPICAACNAPVCRQRDYGILNNAIPVVTNCTQYVTADNEDAQYFLEIEGGTLRLTQRQFTDMREFNSKLEISHGRGFAPMKPVEWTTFKNNCFAISKRVVLDESASSLGEFKIELRTFFNWKAGDKKKSVNEGAAYKSEKEHRVYFQLHYLTKFLERQNFFKHGRRWSAMDTQNAIKSMGGGEDKEFSSGGRITGVYWVPLDYVPKMDTGEEKEGEVL